MLDTVRLLMELSALDNDLDDEVAESDVLDVIKMYVAERLLQPARGADASKRIVPRCMATMKELKTWIQKINDKISAAQTLGQIGPGRLSEEMETIEFSRVSLIQQHELLGVILCRAVEARQASEADFKDFVAVLQKLDKYDSLLGKILESPCGTATDNTHSSSNAIRWCLHLSLRLSRGRT